MANGLSVTPAVTFEFLWAGFMTKQIRAISCISVPIRVHRNILQVIILFNSPFLKSYIKPSITELVKWLVLLILPIYFNAIECMTVLGIVCYL